MDVVVLYVTTAIFERSLRYVEHIINFNRS